jgi:hypothetical protein
MSRAAGKLVMHRLSSGAAIATLDAFFLMRCYGDVSPDDLNSSLDCVEPLIAYRPQGSVSIIVIDPTATFPSEATRRAALEVTRKTSTTTSAMIMVVLGDGFWASAIRGMLMTIGSLSQTTYARKILRYEAEAVDAAIETIGESSSKYRAPLLSSLAQLKSMAVSPPPASSNTPPASKSPPLSSKAPPSSKRRAG